MASPTGAAQRADLIDRILFPYSHERTAAAREHNARFAYYTTAESAFKILSSQKIWLRNARLMNDFSEINHGLQCVDAALNSESGKLFETTLEYCAPGLSVAVRDALEHFQPSIGLDSYIACVSEHLGSEDRNGRLSMWRAYGGNSGVAIIVNGAALFGNGQASSVLSSPVLYADSTSFLAEFARTVEGIQAHRDQLRALGLHDLHRIIFDMLRFAVLCTKHPGFSEEREWRMLASPSLQGVKNLERSTEVLRGVPQTILKLPFKNDPSNGLVGLGLDELLDRIIIGPCAHPQVTYLAFVDLLISLGVSHPDKRVVATDIPLRVDV